MTKHMMLKALSEFFAEHKVESMDLAEYKSHGADVPVKDYLLRRQFGSWNRVLSQVKYRFKVVVPVEVEKPKAAPKVEKKAEVVVEKDDVE